MRTISEIADALAEALSYLPAPSDNKTVTGRRMVGTAIADLHNLAGQTAPVDPSVAAMWEVPCHVLGRLPHTAGCMCYGTGHVPTPAGQPAASPWLMSCYVLGRLEHSSECICHGTGHVPTPAGRALLAFVREWLPR